MNSLRLSKLATGVLLSFALVESALSVNMISVDMDPATPGIQSLRLASPGDTFTVDLVLTVDAAGVSCYAVSVRFDTGELSLNGSPASVNLPPPLWGTLGPLIENNAAGEVSTFSGATPNPGPFSTSFTIGTINFTVVTPLDDALEDVSLGFFNPTVDIFVDNSNISSVPVFNGGFIAPLAVPDSGSTLALLGIGLFGLWAATTRLKPRTPAA